MPGSNIRWVQESQCQLNVLYKLHTSSDARMMSIPSNTLREGVSQLISEQASIPTWYNARHLRERERGREKVKAEAGEK